MHVQRVRESVHTEGRHAEAPVQVPRQPELPQDAVLIGQFVFYSLLIGWPALSQVLSFENAVVFCKLFKESQ